jgi:energy-coupling factor transporter ATP-binding protein EcfA2
MTVIETETQNEIFELPIFYNEKKRMVKENIRKDLEFAHTENENLVSEKEDVEKEEKEKPIYHHVFNLDVTTKNTENEYKNKMVDKMSKYYTTDISFLKDYQKLLKKYKPINYLDTKEDFDLSSMVDTWREIKNDNGFKEKYFYIDWPIWESLNRSELFLQIMSIYNLSAPVLSLLLPIFILIFPFFIIKMKGMDVTMNEYILILKILASNHAFGKLFTEWNSVEFNQKIYLVLSALFYIFSIYQNFLLCIRFHMNMTKIHESIKKIKEYIRYTSLKIDHYLSFSDALASHEQFNRTLKEKRIQLSNLYDKLDKIHTFPFSLFSIGSWNQVFQIGYVLKIFYELYENDIYHELMEYSFEFHTYTDCIEGLQENISNQQVSFAEFEKREKGKEKKIKGKGKGKEERKRKQEDEKEERKRKQEDENAVFQDNYYVVLKDRNPIKNDVSFDKNLILTGPNASGKTTVLKSILINIILTQQFGCGFYTAAYLKPYDYIHCYLNIPDTSGRDSLFQAEAKRCKEILDIIEENKKEERHFCAFDEIYSGTNPEEATLSTVAFIDYLVKYKNVSCILTSHFIKACKKLGKNKRVENYHMAVDSNKSSIKYKYQIEKGISTIQGGIQILKDMNYPQKILDKTDSGFVNSKI